MSVPNHIIARFAVCDDSRGLILGKVLNLTGELEQGHLYQIENWLGELVIRDLGLGNGAVEQEERGKGTIPVSIWNYEANHIVNSGEHLFTPEEANLRRSYRGILD